MLKIDFNDEQLKCEANGTPEEIVTQLSSVVTEVIESLSKGDILKHALLTYLFINIFTDQNTPDESLEIKTKQSL